MICAKNVIIINQHQKQYFKAKYKNKQAARYFRNETEYHAQIKNNVSYS